MYTWFGRRCAESARAAIVRVQRTAVYWESNASVGAAADHHAANPALMCHHEKPVSAKRVDLEVESRILN